MIGFFVNWFHYIMLLRDFPVFFIDCFRANFFKFNLSQCPLPQHLYGHFQTPFIAPISVVPLTITLLFIFLFSFINILILVSSAIHSLQGLHKSFICSLKQCFCFLYFFIKNFYFLIHQTKFF